MKKIFNKLVRDKIPAIIKQDSHTPEICILSKNRFKNELIKKLKEEFREFLKSKDPKELIDIVEVVYALAEVLGLTKKEFNKMLAEKRKKRGGFKKRIFLKSTMSNKKSLLK